MKGLMKRTAAAVAAAAISVSTVMTASAFGSVTEANTPTDKNETALYWATNITTGWWPTPGMAALVGDELVYAYDGNLCAIDKYTGEILQKQGILAADTDYGLSAPVYADGMIFVSETGGVVQAFDAETFESLWVYTDPLGGQANSELTYSDGYIYTGFWTGEASEADFVCIPVEDTDPASTDEEQQAAWTYSVTGGFYWAGAYADGDFVVVGTDNGNSSSDGAGSRILSFDKQASIAANEAVIVSETSEVEGDIRSSVTYDSETDYYYATSKAAYIYRFKVDENGTISDVEKLDLGNASTSTPIAANGRVYVGVSGDNQFGEYTGSHIAVIDSESFEIVYTLETNGYPQSSALISSRDGENYVYFTANLTPGKVYAFHDNKTMTEPESYTTVTTTHGEAKECPVLFTPVGSHSQYCLSSILADEDGTLYFKNDSNTFFALGSKIVSLKADGKTVYKEGDSFDANLKVVAQLANGTEKDVTEYAEIVNLPDTLLEVGTGEIGFSYDGMLYGDTDDETGYEYDAVYGEFEYTVLAADDYDKLYECIDAIDALGEITASSYSDVAAARALYDSLSDTAKGLVENYETLTDAEEKIDAIITAQPVFADSFKCNTSAVKLSWEKSEIADGYLVYRYDSDKKKYVKIADVSADTLSYKDTGLESGTAYKYKIKSYVKTADGTVKSAASAAKKVVTKPSQAEISAFASNESSVKISWKKVSGASGYTVYRYSAKTGKYTKLADVKTLSYKDSGLKTATAYKYKVKAYKELDGVKYYGAASSAKVAATKPSQAKITKTAVSKTAARIYFDKVKNADGYVIEKYDSKTKTWKAVKTVTKAGSCKIEGLKSGNEYKFRVKAYKKAGTEKVYGTASKAVKATTK